ncbi:uncharacterized protein PADG_06349 [Paracoccidioides brasiliensis Pb18]|uniref:Mediator of RNA polymerase II transcription subunit 4 n=1 Tax=Paracoccidioides brasiliensis (strain Pb18) TaxID=502780 RepID=C1GGB2_PARBD|nr:uncharacterized protein PADG_06349 [Paracoccidioides brasiliensis Pb18]EEH50270.2 hypothetical protein PADG_06349 [Paracoccidioides brasiliensis Pb18]
MSREPTPTSNQSELATKASAADFCQLPRMVTLDVSSSGYYIPGPPIMDTQLLTPLSTLETRLNNLLMAIISSPTAAGAPAAALALLDADDSLSRALETLYTHQSNYAKILRLRAEALSLEERVRKIVREVETVGNEISTACQHGADGSDDGSDDDSGVEEEAEQYGKDLDTHMGGVVSDLSSTSLNSKGRRSKEVDYKLLVEFARRISRYNSDAAADASAVRSTRTPPGDEEQRHQQRERSNVENGDAAELAAAGSGPDAAQQTKGVGVAALSQGTVSWLDETANWSRDLSRMQYPSEDRIRMGLMGQLQAAVSEGLDVEKEIERLIRLSRDEGEGDTDDGAASEHVAARGETAGIVGGPGSSAGHGHAGGGIGRAYAAMGGMAPMKTKPKPVLDLELYDPAEDD